MQRHVQSCRRCQLAERCIIIAAPPKFLELFFSFSFWLVRFPSPCLHRIKAAGRIHGWLAGAMELDPTGSSNGAVANHGLYGVDQQRGNVECITLSDSFVVSSGIL
ncbi:unnamed protein product [Sphagnum troendelagicum]|jgi:hypothetical protein